MQDNSYGPLHGNPERLLKNTPFPELRRGRHEAVLRLTSEHTDDDAEQCGTLDHGGGDDHGRADLAGCFGLPGDRFDRRSADPTDAQPAPDQHQSSAEGTEP